ncbi:MAG: LCP family protein [Anaerolineaceae bacterium]|nr:LCP family protein [Anaerolineaceae bacterium]
MKNYAYVIIGGLVILGLIAACVVLGIQLYKSPLAPELVINTNPTATPPAITTKAAAPTLRPTMTQLPQESAQPPKQTPLSEDDKCGEGTMVILVTGGDDSIGLPPYGADFIRYVKVDFDQNIISIISVPRDLWVGGALLASKGLQGYRLGETYQFFKQSASGNSSQKMTVATTSLAQILYENFGLIPDQYMTMDFSTYTTMIDTIGGIDVNVHQPFDAKAVGFTHYFPAGLSHFNGALTVEYVRGFDNEWNRQQRQNEVIEAIRKKLLEPANVLRIPSLINQFSSSITTSLSPEQLVSLTCTLKALPSDRILFYAVAPDMVNAGQNNILYPDSKKIRQLFFETMGRPQ